MKSIKAKLLTLSVLTLLSAPSGICAAPNTAAPSGINSQADLVQWMTYYYLHPQPELLVPAVLFADKAGGLEGDGQAPLTAFISRVMAANPSRIPDWVSQLQPMKVKNRPVLWTALWWSDTKEGKEQLTAIVNAMPQEAQAQLKSQMLEHPSKPLEKLEITTPAVLDELWGAFCATGDEKYVNRLMTALPWVKTEGDYTKLSIGGAAKWSLTSNAEQHPLVMKLCKKARDTQPQLRPYLDTVILEANNRLNKSTAENNTKKTQ